MIPDDPIISSMERTGYPPNYGADVPRCPVCGSECETIYKDLYLTIVGCDFCIEACDATYEDQCFK